MTYSITPADVASITDLEIAFGTTRLPPEVEAIPAEFKSQCGNIYTRITDSIFMGTDMPQGEIVMKDGFDPETVNRCVRAHICSWSPKHEHKIAGVGYMISMMMTIVEKATNENE